MFVQMVAAQQTNGDTLSEAIKNMHMGTSADSGGRWRGFFIAQATSDNEDTEWEERARKLHLHTITREADAGSIYRPCDRRQVICEREP